MKLNILHILFTLLCAAGILSACTEDTSLPQSDEGKAGRVVFSYSVAGGTLSRAPEAGWNEGWNENEVDRLDLLVFRNQTLIRHYGEDLSPQITANQNNDEGRNYHDWEIPEAKLSPDDIQQGDVVYLIANCPTVTINGASKSLSEITSLAELQAASIGTLSCHEKQNTFVMTGTATVGEKSGNDVVIKVDLYRAAAKIRISFSDDSKSNWSDGIAYRFVQYAQTSALLEEQDEDYLSTLQLSTYPAEGADEEYELVNTSSADNYYTNGQQLVLYSYVNNWYQQKEDELYGEIPIDEKKQTHIILLAPYGNDGKKYYYKVPVNYQLPEDNDATTPNASYKDLYRLQRNHIYDITVTIDREGGPESKPVPVNNLEVVVVPWEEKGIEVPAFE